MSKRKHVLLPFLFVVLVGAAAVLGIKVYDARTYSVLPTSDATAGFENTLIATPGVSDGSLTALEFAKAINGVRAENKLQDFTINQNLMAAASDLAVSYLNTGKTTVTDTDWSAISASGYQYASANILSSSAKVVTAANAQGFFNGRATKDTLTSDVFQDFGVAIVEGLYNGEQTNVIVLMFATPASSYIPIPYDESTANGAIPSTGGSDSGVTPTTCNETQKAAYKQTYDNDVKAADDARAADVANISNPQSDIGKKEVAAANSRRDATVATAYSSYTSSLKSINCSV